jgi:hypothetical protein
MTPTTCKKVTSLETSPWAQKVPVNTGPVRERDRFILRDAPRESAPD